MPFDTVHAVTLHCHPDTPAAAVRGVAARVGRNTPEELAVTFILDADPDRLRIPAPRAPRVAHQLWEHTCCEIFIARKGLPAYCELNLSPSGEWAAYAFDGYRSPRAEAPHAEEIAPAFKVRGAPNGFKLDAVINLDRIPVHRSGAPLSLALSAVVESREGALSYWALRHPPGKPDFHHPDAFALELG